MNIDELTQLTAVQQTVLTRHDREIAGITAILNRVAQQQEANAHPIETNSHPIQPQPRGNWQTESQHSGTAQHFV